MQMSSSQSHSDSDDKDLPSHHQITKHSMIMRYNKNRTLQPPMISYMDKATMPKPLGVSQHRKSFTISMREPHGQSSTLFKILLLFCTCLLH